MGSTNHAQSVFTSNRPSHNFRITKLSWLIKASFAGLLVSPMVNAEIELTGQNSNTPINDGVNSGFIIIGFQGEGTMTVNNGFQVISTGAHIGNQRGGYGVVTITGQGTKWENNSASGAFNIGNSAASGDLTISDGAKVIQNTTATTNFWAWNDNPAPGKRSTANILIEGEGSELYYASMVRSSGRGGKTAIILKDRGTLTIPSISIENEFSLTIGDNAKAGIINVKSLPGRSQNIDFIPTAQSLYSLVFSQTDSEYAFNVPISRFDIYHNTVGTTKFSKIVNRGTMQVLNGIVQTETENIFRNSPNIFVDTAGTLSLNGNSQSTGLLRNAGTVVLSSDTQAANTASTTLTVQNYESTSDNSKLVLSTKLDDDDANNNGSSKSDILIVSGDVSGKTNIMVNNVGGSGDLTTRGIKVVQVDGNSTGDNFVLTGESISLRANNKQQFTYRLYQGIDGVAPSVDTTGIDTNDWYLRSNCSDGSHTVGNSVTAGKYDGLGCLSDDIITVTTDATLDKVEGAGGADTIMITDNAIVNGNVYGGENGIDSSSDHDSDDTIIVSGTAQIDGTVYGNAGNDNFIWSDASTINALYGGDGSDTAIISSTGYDGSQVLDGGDDNEISDGDIDTLNINNLTVSAGGRHIFHWETVNLNDTTFKLTDTLTVSADKNYGLNINAGSTLGLSAETATVKGQVTNSGTIDLTSTSTATETLNINGNYIGNSGSTIKLNTIWNAPGDAGGSDSESDILNISGTATGSTKVISVKADGTENIIDGNIQQISQVINTIPVINVNITGDTVFTGITSTTGAAEAQLAKRIVNGKDEYYWTISALTPAPTPDPTIYDNTVSGYVQTPWANLEQAYAVLRTFHERRGDNQYLGQNANGQAWAKLLGSHLRLDGKERLGFDLAVNGVQIGYDFSSTHTANGGYGFTGIYGAFSHGNAKFNDQFRAENGIITNDKYTGRTKTDMWSLGLTHTRYSTDGSYVDLVGQLSRIQNSYNSRTAVTYKNKGVSAILSAETGKVFDLPNSGWVLEPQAQIMYQAVKLNDFTDSKSKQIDYSTQHNIRARVGVRLAYNAQQMAETVQAINFYTVANLWTDLVKPKAVKIGSDTVRENYSSLWGELGIGFQLPVTQNSYFYVDGRYERNLTRNQREAYRGTVGYQYTWK